MSSKNAQIFVTKLSRNTTQEDLRKSFRKFGPIKEVTIKKGYGFVVSIFPYTLNETQQSTNTRTGVRGLPSR